MYVISLSTIPPRFDHLQATLESLVSQDNKPEVVQLYIPRKYRRFPDWDGSLPSVPKGVEICRVDEDLGPATKVLFAAQALRGTDLGLLFCDDDRLYLRDWSSRLLAGWNHHPDAAIASCGFDIHHLHLPMPEGAPMPRCVIQDKQTDWQYHWARAKQKFGKAVLGRPIEMKPARNRFKTSGYAHVAEGLGGVLLRPDWITDDAMTIPPVMWSVDDVWISGHLAKNGHPVWVEAKASRFLTAPTQKLEPLYAAKLDGAGRDDANVICAKHFIASHHVWC